MSKPMREAYGDALLEMAEDKDLVVLDADLSKATTSGKFAAAYPERFFNMGIAEQNLMGTAAGMAIGGLKPFASTFAMFATGRAFEQIRNAICYPHVNVKIIATHAGLSANADGGSHQTVEDMALMRALPGMMVLSPCDYLQAKKMMHLLKDHVGPAYMRLSRHPAIEVSKEEDVLDFLKADILAEGDQVLLMATGVMVGIAMEAREILKSEGINIEVMNVHTIKPLDKETVLREARRIGTVLTLEEHSVIGGLGAAVAETLSMETGIRQMIHGIPDVFGQSGDYEELMSAYGLDVQTVVEKIRILLGGVDHE